MDKIKLFETFLFSAREMADAENKSERQALEKIYRIREELRVGQWDYDRLLPDRGVYEERKLKWRGVKTFRYAAWKHEAIEARTIIAFLDGWTSRKDNLEAAISELEFHIKGMH